MPPTKNIPTPGGSSARRWDRKTHERSLAAEDINGAAAARQASPCPLSVTTGMACSLIGYSTTEVDMVYIFDSLLCCVLLAS